jgi:hypothetical protein
MDAMERRALESAAGKYSYLRGLLFVPLGLLFVVSALGNWRVGPLRHAWAFLVAAAFIGAVWLLINRYYNEIYGRLSPSTKQQVRGAVALLIAVVVMVGGASLLRSRADWSLDLPVNAIAVSFAVIMLISYGIGVGLRSYHVIVWGALFLTGAMPVWNGADPSNVGLVLAGVALMVSGVFDHRLFVQTFGSPKVLHEANGDVAA